MASVDPSEFGGRHQWLSGTPRFWWLSALYRSHRNCRRRVSVNCISLASDVSTFQNPGMRERGERVPILPNRHQESRLLKSAVPLVMAVITAGSDPKGASKADGSYH